MKILSNPALQATIDPDTSAYYQISTSLPKNSITQHNTY